MLSKKFDPISRGHDLYIYYMIKLYLYIIWNAIGQVFQLKMYKLRFISPTF
jgi:hypothetical protein